MYNSVKTKIKNRVYTRIYCRFIYLKKSFKRENGIKSIIFSVMDVPWEVRVQSSHGVAGGAALLTCSVPSTVRHHMTVTRWFKDGGVLAPLAAEAGTYILQNA